MLDIKSLDRHTTLQTENLSPDEASAAAVGAFVMRGRLVMDASTGPRCDRCGATAKWLYLDADNEWQWCDHHDRELRTALISAGFDRYELAVPDVRNVGARAIHGG